MPESKHDASERVAADLARLYGPWRFFLDRQLPAAPEPVRAHGRVADGVMFPGGSCVLCWRGSIRSLARYDTIDDLLAVHAHDGRTAVVWIDEPPSEAFARGASNCYQDRCENCPFSSVGGLERRSNMRAPEYVAAADAEDYLRGYRAQALDMYGADWATCSFSWSPAITIE